MMYYLNIAKKKLILSIKKYFYNNIQFILAILLAFKKWEHFLHDAR